MSWLYYRDLPREERIGAVLKPDLLPSELTELLRILGGLGMLDSISWVAVESENDDGTVTLLVGTTNVLSSAASLISKTPPKRADPFRARVKPTTEWVIDGDMRYTPGEGIYFSDKS